MADNSQLQRIGNLLGIRLRVFLAGAMVLQTPALSQERAGALEDYLAKPASSVKWDWPGGPPQISVRKYQQMFRGAKSPAEKAIAIGNLSVIAHRMAMGKESRAAGRQLNDEWVMPHIETTRAIGDSHSIGWRHCILRTRNIYRLCGDHAAEKQCLAALFSANAKEGDQDLAVYLLAYQQARLGDYVNAIKTLEFLKEDSKYAKDRTKLIRIWTKEANKKQKAATP